MRALLAALALTLTLGGCATTPPTPAACAQWQAGLAAAQAALPPLEATYEAMLSPTSKSAAADIAKAKALLDAAQALVTADQAYVAEECSPPT
jgi:hypothetical protein